MSGRRRRRSRTPYENVSLMHTIVVIVSISSRSSHTRSLITSIISEIVMHNLYSIYSPGIDLFHSCIRGDLTVSLSVCEDGRMNLSDG